MSTIKPTTVPSKRLSETINGSASSFKLNNIEGWDGADLTSADFGTVAYAVFRNSAGTLMEIMEIDPSTIASASITINKRGLKFTGDLTTEVAANKLTWVRGDTIVELGSHPPQLLNSYVDLYNEQTITGMKSVSTPTASGHIASKGYVDSLAFGGSGNVDKIIEAGNAGETVAAGNLLYFDTTDNEWKKTDADTLASIYNVKLGIAQGAGADGGAISGGVLTKGIDSNQTGMTQGDIMYAINTAGGIGSTVGTIPRVVGIARTATSLYFDPDFLRTPYVYAADSVGSDSYAVTLPESFGAYFTGMRITFKAGTANTGACTLAVNGGAAKAIKKDVSTDLVTGDILQNQIIEVVYDGTNFQIISMISGIITTQNITNSGISIVKKITINTTEVLVSNTTNETTLFTSVIPAGTLSTNNAVRIKIFCSDVDLATGVTLTIKLKYGNTTLATVVNIAENITSTDYKGWIEAYLIADGSASAQKGVLSYNFFTNDKEVKADVAVGIGKLMAAGNGAATEDSTGDLNLVISATFSNDTTANQITAEFEIIEKIS
jgi:hypothetical protein